MEERIARLEVTTDHIQSDVTELKANVKQLDSKVDAQGKDLGTKIENLERTMREKLEKLAIGQWANRVWALLLAGVVLGVMARGFHWI